jgi:hypothetical protein
MIFFTFFAFLFAAYKQTGFGICIQLLFYTILFYRQSWAPTVEKVSGN